MNFSSLIVPIIGHKANGLLKVFIEKDYDNLILVIEFYKIQISQYDRNSNINNTIFDSIINKCDRNPFNVDTIFNSVSTELLCRRTYTYSQIENLDERLKIIDQFNTKNTNEIITIHEVFKYNFTGRIRDARRIQRFVHSFLENFNIIHDTVNLFIQNKIEENKNNEIREEIKHEEETVEEITQNTLEESLIVKIINFSMITPQIQGFIYHQILNNYRFYDDAVAERDDNTKILTITTPEIFTPSTNYNKTFYTSLVDSISEVPIDNITLIMKNMIKFFDQNFEEFTSLHIKVFMCIYYLYNIAFSNNKYNSWVWTKFDNIITDTSTQEKLLNKLYKEFIEINIVFKVNTSKYSSKEFVETCFENEISEIGTKYKYLSSMSQKDFADIVLKNTTNKIDNDIELPPVGNMNILNITNYMNMNNKPSLFNLLNYRNDIDKSDNKIISVPYKVFNDYIENPISITKINNDEVPFVIIKIFESLETILTNSVLSKDNTNTMEYYKILYNKFGNNLDYTHYLYIIFQLIIPFYYYNYDITNFYDRFLI